MRRVVQAAERVRNGVHVADARAREREARLERGDHHVLPQGEIAAVLVCLFQIGKDQLHRFFRQTQTLLGIVGPAHIGLDGVGQRVHTGSGRGTRRQADGQLRVEHRVARHKMQIHHRIFVVRLRIRDDGGNRRLAAGAGGCRNGDDGRHGLADA